MFEANCQQQQRHSLTMRQSGQQQMDSSVRSRSSASGGGAGRPKTTSRFSAAPNSHRAGSAAAVVPAFTIRSIQSGNRVEKPPRIDVFAERPTPSVAFRRIYQRGDLPVHLIHESRLYRLGWKASLYSPLIGIPIYSLHTC